MGKEATQHFLDLQQSDSFKIKSVIRGHQHHGTTGKDLIKFNNFVKQWDGLVLTIISGKFCPDNSAAFIVVKLDEESDCWQIDHYFSRDQLRFDKIAMRYF